MTQIIEKPELSFWVERAAADELLFELRRGQWRSLRPELLLEPPEWTMPGSVPIEKASYLVAYLEAHPYLENPHLEIAILKQDYKDALNEIEALGLTQAWRAFFGTNAQLYRIEQRSSKFYVGERTYVTQNRHTGRAERTAMNCIWAKVVTRHYTGEHCLL